MVNLFFLKDFNENHQNIKQTVLKTSHELPFNMKLDFVQIS